jgi:hypothetical protein
MAREIPVLVRAAAGFAATVLDEARKLPETLPGLSVRVIGLAMQRAMKIQQHYAGFVARGDEIFTGLRGENEPGLATFDDDIEPAPTPGFRDSAFDRAGDSLLTDTGPEDDDLAGLLDDDEAEAVVAAAEEAPPTGAVLEEVLDELAIEELVAEAPVADVPRAETPSADAPVTEDATAVGTALVESAEAQLSAPATSPRAKKAGTPAKKADTPAKKAQAKKAPAAKKTAAKKAPAAKKTAAKKTAVPAKKAAVTPTPAPASDAVLAEAAVPAPAPVEETPASAPAPAVPAAAEPAKAAPAEVAPAKKAAPAEVAPAKKAAPAEAAPAKKAAPAPATPSSTAPATPAIDGYDDFSIALLRGHLRGYAQKTVEELLTYEEAGRAREPYLRMLRNRLERLRADSRSADRPASA